MNRVTLIREDRNGTKYYHHVCTCGKCGGSGIIRQFIPINGGECFDCNGAGIIEYQTKEYTPEYEAKLIARREKAEAKRLEKRKNEAVELNKAFYERHGFNENGEFYVALGDTFAIKDELKEHGFRFDKIIGWYSDTESEEFKTAKFNANDAFETDNVGVFLWNCPQKVFYMGNEKIEETDGLWEDGFHWEWKVVDIVKEMNAELRRNDVKNVSGHVGNIGDKIEVVVTVKREVECVFKVSSWCSNTSTLFIMNDEDGNVYTWKTASLPTIKTDDKSKAINRNGETLMKFLGEGDTIKIKGTVKEHSEYNGVKQTVLTRCKVVE